MTGVFLPACVPTCYLMRSQGLYWLFASVHFFHSFLSTDQVVLKKRSDWRSLQDHTALPSFSPSLSILLLLSFLTQLWALSLWQMSGPLAMSKKEILSWWANYLQRCQCDAWTRSGLFQDEGNPKSKISYWNAIEKYNMYTSLSLVYWFTKLKWTHIVTSWAVPCLGMSWRLHKK